MELETQREYIKRLERAAEVLGDMAGETGSIFADYNESTRLQGKKEGVLLALSYFDEMVRSEK